MTDDPNEPIQIGDGYEDDAQPNREELEYELYNRNIQASVKQYESHTTRAETAIQQLYLKAAESTNPFSFASNQYSNYQSLNAPSELITRPDYNPTKIAHDQYNSANQQSRVVHRLKEALKGQQQTHQAKLEIIDIQDDEQATYTQTNNSKDWSSLASLKESREPSSLLLAKVQSQGGSMNMATIDPKSSSIISKLKEHAMKPRVDEILSALYDFEGETNKDLSFKRGDSVRVIDKRKNGWWLAEVDGRIGFVPSNYLTSE